MYCRKCGEHITEDSVYCFNCGEEVVNQISEESSQSNIEVDVDVASESTNDQDVILGENDNIESSQVNGDEKLSFFRKCVVPILSRVGLYKHDSLNKKRAVGYLLLFFFVLFWGALTYRFLEEKKVYDDVLSRFSVFGENYSSDVETVDYAYSYRWKFGPRWESKFIPYLKKHSELIKDLSDEGLIYNAQSLRLSAYKDIKSQEQRYKEGLNLFKLAKTNSDNAIVYIYASTQFTSPTELLEEYKVFFSGDYGTFERVGNLVKSSDYTSVFSVVESQFQELIQHFLDENTLLTDISRALDDELLSETQIADYRERARKLIDICSNDVAILNRAQNIWGSIDDTIEELENSTKETREKIGAILADHVRFKKSTEPITSKENQKNRKTSTRAEVATTGTIPISIETQLTENMRAVNAGQNRNFTKYRELIYDFNNAWIDYVNNGNEKVFEFVVKDSPLYKTLRVFNRKNLREKYIKMELKSVAVENGRAMIFMHEEIEKAKGVSKPQIIKYDWIYYCKNDLLYDCKINNLKSVASVRYTGGTATDGIDIAKITFGDGNKLVFYAMDWQSKQYTKGFPAYVATYNRERQTLKIDISGVRDFSADLKPLSGNGLIKSVEMPVLADDSAISILLYLEDEKDINIYDLENEGRLVIELE